MTEELGLHLKYRPTDLNGVVGNAETVAALSAVLLRGEGEAVPRTLLFSGPRGCGKTTLARIFAARAGCHEQDFHEVNAADARGIETVRDIRQAAQYRPMRGPVSVWLLDEAHMLTREAQTALLKLAEDTPPHVRLLLATTDPAKLLPTLRDRCMPFSVSPLTEEELTRLLEEVCEAEGIKRMDSAVLSRIARDALGSPRAALVVLDKVRDLPPDARAAAAERQAAAENATIDLCRALIKGAPWRAVAAILKGLGDEEPEGVRRAVLGYCSSVLLGGGPQRAYAVMVCFDRPCYDNGRPGLVMGCYEAANGAR